MNERRPKLLIGRRALMIAFGSHVAMPMFREHGNMEPAKLPFLRDIQDVAMMMEGDQLRPFFRHPMVRLIDAEGGPVTRWHIYSGMTESKRKQVYAVEVVAPDGNGAPRFTTLKIG